MCGIYAVVKKRGTFGKDQGEILFNLGVITTLRGWDGSGVAAVNQKGKSTSLKIGSDFNHLIRSEPWNKFLDDIKNSKVSFGHARAATVGNVNTDNAHPFVYKSVTLVHNGTLEDKYVSRVSGDLKFEVDSNVLAKVLKENEDDVCQVLKTIDGAFALMWHNTNNNTFYVARNHQRPLFYADLHSCFVFSSEKDFLEFALKRTKNYEVNCIKEVIAGRLFEFNISKDDA